MTKIQYNNVFIQNILNKSLIDKNIQFAILRLDKIHPIISGNKWFKLKYYIAINKDFFKLLFNDIFNIKPNIEIFNR